MTEKTTATVLLLNLPPSTLCGIDLLSFTTSPRFHGIKNLSPGWHFVFTGLTSSLSLRHGAWFYVHGTPDGPPELFIKKWDPAREELVDETDEAAQLRWRANLGSIWSQGLSPYRQSATSTGEADEETDDWRQLTSHITPTLLTRITGDTPNHWALTSASAAARDIELIPGLSASESGGAVDKELHFLPVDLKQTWRAGATGRERTDAAQDRSWALSELVRVHCSAGGEEEVLGELQFTFLVVLTLNNYSCLEQWKRLLSLLLTCRSAVVSTPQLFVRAIVVLRLQLKHSADIEGGLFDLSEDGAALLKSLLRRFRAGLEGVSGDGKGEVLDELDALEAWLRAEQGWEIGGEFVRRGMLELEDGERVEMEVGGFEAEDESGEYAPAVVELTSEQARALGGVAGALSDEDETRGLAEDEDERDLENMDDRY
ncbi:A1 cistron-splicing factor [Cryomyces antarcticus]